MSFKEVDPVIITLGEVFEDSIIWHKIKEIPFT